MRKRRGQDAGDQKLPLVMPVLFYTGKRSPFPALPVAVMKMTGLTEKAQEQLSHSLAQAAARCLPGR